MTIHDKLQKVQEQLKAPKSQTNTFGKYKYRNCEDILEAVKPLLAANGLTITISDKMVFLGGRHYVIATATLYDGEGYVEATAYAREEDSQKGMSASQLTGATSSYARKYALNGLLLIDDTKDADATNTHGKETMGMTHKEIAEQWPIDQQTKSYNNCLTQMAGWDSEGLKKNKANVASLIRKLEKYGSKELANDLQQALTEKESEK